MKNIITIHPTTVTYTDFGDYLDTVHGVTFSVNGNAIKGSFEHTTVAKAKARFPEDNASVCVTEGEPIARMIALNTRGLI